MIEAKGIFNIPDSVVRTSSKEFRMRKKEVEKILQKGREDKQKKLQEEKNQADTFAMQLLTMNRKGRRIMGAKMGIKIAGIDSHKKAL